MKLLSNPIVVRMLLLLILGGFALFAGIAVIRRLRRGLVEEATFPTDLSSPDALPLETYSAVIQQLKQQKHELQSVQQLEKRRSRASETISGSIISTLPCGVLFFTSNGLVRQANSAAKQILGFSSPLGMSADEVFRKATAETSNASRHTLAQLIAETLVSRSSIRHLETDYRTPAGGQRVLEVTLTSVQSPTGEFFGLTCLLNDQTEMRDLRLRQALRDEMSLTMALELRKSLSAISAYAKHNVTNGDSPSETQRGNDIMSEAAHVETTVGAFLSNTAAKGASGG
ncbi:MAG: PAS domain-containing protein [Acidobacteriaceae bacterium]